MLFNGWTVLLINKDSFSWWHSHIFSQCIWESTLSRDLNGYLCTNALKPVTWAHPHLSPHSHTSALFQLSMPKQDSVIPPQTDSCSQLPGPKWQGMFWLFLSFHTEPAEFLLAGVGRAWCWETGAGFSWEASSAVAYCLLVAGGGTARGWRTALPEGGLNCQEEWG